MGRPHELGEGHFGWSMLSVGLAIANGIDGMCDRLAWLIRASSVEGDSTFTMSCMYA
jgi:hypothetical protein